MAEVFDISKPLIQTALAIVLLSVLIVIKCRAQKVAAKNVVHIA